MTPHRQTWQTHKHLDKQVHVQGVSVQADVLQVPAEKVSVAMVAERVFLHRLDVVVLRGEARLVFINKISKYTFFIFYNKQIFDYYCV